MVTKQANRNHPHKNRSVLAKIHMVTKLILPALLPTDSSVLAKIHMVTKL